MANLTDTRRKFVIASGALVAISVLAGIYLIFPLTPPTAESYRRLEETRNELKTKEKNVLPLRGLPRKLEKAQSDIKTFYRQRVPTRSSTVNEEIGRLASRNGVVLTNVHYDTLETNVPTLEVIALDANLTGEYAKVVRFINAVERNKIFFLIDGLNLADQKGGIVRLEVKLETYLRRSSPDDAATETQSDPHHKPKQPVRSGD